MNAQPCAIADALAHAGFADSVDAKGREGTGPHRTAPNGVLSVWSPSHHGVTYVTRDAHDGMMSGDLS